MVKKPLLAPEVSEKTLAERALRLLREDILATRLAPDMRLRIAELQKRYQLGISPIREALLRLISEGFVVAQGQRGFAVASVSIEELQDLTRARIGLEAIMVTEASSWMMRNGKQVSSRLSTCCRGPRYRPAVRTWRLRCTGSACHRAFHHALLAGCGSPWMQRLQTQMAEHAERYRRIRMFHSVTNDKLVQSINNEHESLMHAMLQRDTGKAVALVQSHLNNTANAVAGFYKPAVKG